MTPLEAVARMASGADELDAGLSPTDRAKIAKLADDIAAGWGELGIPATASTISATAAVVSALATLHKGQAESQREALRAALGHTDVAIPPVAPDMPSLVVRGALCELARRLLVEGVDQ